MLRVVSVKKEHNSSITRGDGLSHKLLVLSLFIYKDKAVISWQTQMF
nr:MAG TPA: hypothetical protein [Caudoviricetes sp.]